MDLGAYANIQDLSAVASANGIYVPRLRGYRLMANEETVTQQEITELEHEMTIVVYEDACDSCPRFTPGSSIHEFSWRTRARKERFLKKNGELRWDLIHGKARKRIKFAVKKKKRAVRKQYETFNRYAGREDVLYIHARIGGGNWINYGGPNLETQPWFLERVDDCYDSTYCDIYAKINNQTEAIQNG